MTLLTDGARLRQRSRELGGSLATLAASLRAELQPLLDRGWEVPRLKAALSRDGGRCPRDGAALEFDPYAPHAHTCPACGTVYTGDHHDRWWITFYQLWLAERAVHAALLNALHPEEQLAALARGVLTEAAEAYVHYPNRDNVLGPTRPFFSTYLESIWTLQLAVALDLLELSGAQANVGQIVRDRLIEPSVALIATFDEATSNRQVWNNAAIMAAARLLDRPALMEAAVLGRSGLLSQLLGPLLPDGTWYEGDNYHLFAHRGLWYGVRMAQEAGITLPAEALARFDAGFATPFATALPDFTFPSRRDSPHRVSLRQWRMAESCELGLVRHDDAQLLGALAELYRPDVAAGDTGRWRSTAETERNVPPVRLTRSDLGWRSLLLARAELPPLAVEPARSVLMPGQGLAILRRDGGNVYAALDYGSSGGGHGHPDRLDVLLAVGRERWLDDPGTGSYVDPSLHWYRSTLAHNAPLVGGHSQPRVDGVLRAFDERGGAGWVDATMEVATPAATIGRSLVAMPDYVVDRVRVSAAERVRLDLPIHAAMDVEGARWVAGTLDGERGLEDGFSFVHDAESYDVSRHDVVGASLRDSAAGRAWTVSSVPAQWWRAVAPGVPGASEAFFHIVRIDAREAWIATVWSWGASVKSVELRDDTVVIRHGDGSVHEHAWRADGWHIELMSGGARSSIDLSGDRPVAAPTEASHTPPPTPLALPHDSVLAASSYRRSEQTWDEAGGPKASVNVSADAEALVVRLDVEKLPLCVRAQDAPDPQLDNENPDVNSDGAQLYVWADGWRAPAAWLAVPVRGSERLRLSAVAGSRTDVPVDARWAETPHGWRAEFRVPRSCFRGATVALDLVVNEISPDRVRRRGQLVLSGGEGWVYLRGDRHERDHWLTFALP